MDADAAAAAVVEEAPISFQPPSPPAEE